MIFNKERWENRIIKHSVQYSPARRSMCVTIHLAKSRELWIVGTYIHHAPDQHVDEVHREWEWIEERVSDGRSRRGTVMVAGDFNTYSNEHLDRSAPGDMSGRARDMCRQFDAWTESLGITSTFRSRHPNTQRHTYCRNGTRTALDDIFVSSEHESAISASAIWLNSITTSDHVGVPVAILQCERGARVARNLNNVTPIKVVNTRTKTQDELDEFTHKLNELDEFTLHTATMLDSGVIRLVDDIDVENSTQEQIQQWLERAIDNLYSCLYTSAKNLWGEVNQSKRHLARAVCIRRSNRCTSQLRLAKELLGIPEVTVETLQIAADAICWPKWVLHPDSMVEGSAHQNGARTINAMLTNIPLSNMYEEWIDWFEDIIKHWKSTIRIRRNWRQTSRRKLCQDRRRNWFVAGRTKAFLQTTLGKPLPPVSIRSAIIQEEGSARYTEDRSEVNRELTRLLDNWIPVDEQTTRPRYLDTALPEDAASLPDFAREWILPDIERGGRYVSAWSGAGKRWDDYHYTAEIQTTIDRKLKKHVAPGYGGISQEMWIASPAIVRHRERRVIELILRTGLAPKILLRKQMIFLPKTQTVDPTLDNSKGLPPWRPITVQSAFANRVFLVIKEFVDRGIPNSGLQHGFRNDRSVIDASLLTTLLLDRAKENRERLLLVSKDCLKCYDRIPSWVMELLYMGIGVPVMARKLMIDFLGSGNIDVRTAFGWLSTGEREFGIGQGSILAILHISVYMGCLQNQLATSVDPVSIRHHQAGHGIEVASTMFVDDQLDVSTTYEGLLDRARITNMFTGKDATGGVFGSAKSFQMYVTPDPEHFPAVMLNDGHSVPQPVRVVAPEEGFKHLGIQQGGEDQWATSLEPTWKTLVSDADRIRRLSLSLPEFRYVVNHIWIPRFRYRMLLGGAIKMAARVDVFIRQVARSVLKLPYYLPTAVYYDKGNGLGLESCEADANINRLVEALRILNTPELPVYHLLVERLEAYQIRAGLTDNPLCKPIAPPGTVTTWIAQVLRYAAALEPPLTMAIRWVQPRNARSERLNDRALMDLTPSEHHTTLLSINWKWDFKLRYVGDITSDMGTHILPFVTIMRSGKWDEKTRAKVEILYNLWRTALVIPTTNRLLIPVGCIPVDPRQTPAAVRIGVGHWIVAIRMNTEGPEPVIDQYELGYRDVGDAQMHQLGLTIPIRWWYERPRGSDIWFERTHRVLEDSQSQSAGGTNVLEVVVSGSSGHT
ncbi:hypothetical protein PHMEG_0005727 [Phytophthora megakarya]|uniref:Reverse transcriptase domain-containing protein n=1 Tax=Phytophthora megakarya TaxID=4795 RepID=A0A225WQM4_9STRA|nr:hypothetical protein PHMEG_0005727 [Phytophthora megakarya]